MRRYGVRTAIAGVGFALVATVLMIAPSASAATLGVTLKKPYAGNPVTGQYQSNSGLSCAGTGSYTYLTPWFSPAKGRGSTGQQSESIICGAWVDEYHSLDSYFGMSDNITMATSLNHDVVKFHWTLTYSVYLQSAWSGGNATAYSFAVVYLTAFVYDMTTGVSTGSGSSYYNQSYVLDSSNTVFFTVYQAHPVMSVVLNLIAGDTYEFETYVTAETRSESYGPSSATDTGYAQVVFPGSPAGGLLASITY